MTDNAPTGTHTGKLLDKPAVAPRIPTESRDSARLREWAGQLFGLDLRSLALFRIGMALLLLADLFYRLRDLTAFYTSNGVLPTTYWGGSHLMVHHLDGSAAYSVTLFVIAAFVAILMLFGYWTRIATIVSWFLLCSVQTRCPLTGDSGQDLFRLLLFWGMFLPWGARYSVDAALNPSRWSGARRVVSVGSVALMIQMCLLYWISYKFKTGPEWREDGSATYYTLSLELLASPFGTWLLHFPVFLRGLTFFVLGLEMVMPWAFFFPWRNAVFRGILLVLMMGMHLGFTLCLWIELFPFVCLVAWLAFIPSGCWDAVAGWRWPGGVERHVAHFASRYRAALGKVAGWLPIIRWQPPVWLAVVGTVTAQIFAAIWLIYTMGWNFLDVRSVPINVEILDVYLAIVYMTFWLPLYYWRGDGLLAWISRVVVVANGVIPVALLLGALVMSGGSTMDNLLGLVHTEIATSQGGAITFSPGQQLSVKPTTWNFAATMHQIWWTIDRPESSWTGRIYYLVTFYNLGQELRLDQHWGMFAPSPSRGDGWYVMSARLHDGSYVDLWSGRPLDVDPVTGRPRNWPKPPSVAGHLPNYRWFKFMENYFRNNAPSTCQFLCREWNQSHPADRRVVTLEVYFVSNFSQPPYIPRSVNPESITKCQCNRAMSPP